MSRRAAGPRLRPIVGGVVTTMVLFLATLVTPGHAATPGTNNAPGGGQDDVRAATVRGVPPPPTTGHRRSGHPEQSGRAASLGWQDGAIQYSTVRNCLHGYPERGVGTHVGYYGDPAGGIPHVATQYTYVHLVVAGLGRNCVGHWFFPSFHLPADVEWYRDAAIICYYNGNPMSGQDCPQWSSLFVGQGPHGSDRYDHPGESTWGVPPGGIMEFLLPVWAPRRAVSGSNMAGYVELADGENFTPLVPTAPLWFFGSPPTFCQGRQVTVDLALGQRPTAGHDVIRGTARGESILGGGGNDVVCAGGGDDVVNGGGGADSLHGGPGRDRCAGGRGVDRATGCEVRSGIP